MLFAAEGDALPLRMPGPNGGPGERRCQPSRRCPRQGAPRTRPPGSLRPWGHGLLPSDGTKHLLSVSVLEIVNVLPRELGVRTVKAVLQIRQCLWTDERKHGKGLVQEVAKHDLSHRKAILLLKVAQALEAIAIFLVIKEKSDASIRRNLVQRVLLEASKVAAWPGPNRQTLRGHA